MIERSPKGTDEVVYSNVTKTESGRGCGFGRGEYQPRDMFASFPGNFTDKEEFFRAKIF